MPPTFDEAVIGVFSALVAIIWMGLGITLLGQLLVATREQWEHLRSPDGYFPGALDADRRRHTPEIGGVGPTLTAGVAAVVLGMSVYFAGGFAVILGGAGMILLSGMSVNFLPPLYVVGALAVIAGWTSWIKIDRMIRCSDVYQGWY
jgi:hypothetical protein